MHKYKISLRKESCGGMHDIPTTNLIISHNHTAGWGKKLLLAGLMAVSAAAATHSSNVSAELAKRMTSDKAVKIEIYNDRIATKFRGAKFDVSFSEFSKVAGILRKSNAKGVVHVIVSHVPKTGSRRMNVELKKDGKEYVRVERRDAAKILEFANQALTYEEGIKIFKKGNCANPLFYTYSGENADYIVHLGRELYRFPIIGDLVEDIHRINIDIGPSEREKFQALATAIVRAEYGGRDVSAKEAVIAINKWISHNIIFSGTNKEYIGKLRTFGSAIEVLMHGTGVCFDHATLMDALCNSIGIPARIVWVGKTLKDRILGTGTHIVVEVDFGNGWFIFDPTNRYMTTDEYYTREEYHRLLAILGDGDLRSPAHFFPSRPIMSGK